MAAGHTQSEYLLADQIILGQMPLGVVEEVLEHDDFIDRYVGAIELGDTVSHQRTTVQVAAGRVSVLHLAHWNWQHISPSDRPSQDELMRTRLDRDEARRELEAQIAQQEAARRYFAHGKTARLGSVLLSIVSSRSSFRGVIGPRVSVPDVIFSDGLDNDLVKEILIDHLAAERLGFLPRLSAS